MKNGNIHPRRGLLKLLLPTVLLTLSFGALQGCLDTGSAVDSSSKDQARLKGETPKSVKDTVKTRPVKDTGMVCIQVVVCGVDGKIYSDPCAADAAKVKYGYDLAACDAPVTIEPIPVKPPEVNPPAIVIDPVETPDPIDDDMGACTADFAPVCGADGKTYSNACQASLHKAKVVHTGKCP